MVTSKVILVSCLTQLKDYNEDISGERLSGGSNKAEEAILDIQARGFWEEH